MSGFGPALAWAHPAWLWGLAALAVPLAIHLLSRGQQRRVLVGSVRLLRAAPSRHLRRLRPTRLLLLAVRCLLLAVVAIALAGLRWSGAAAAPPASWTLVDPALLADSSPGVASQRGQLLEQLRSAGEAGSELRLLAAGLPPFDPDAPVGADASLLGAAPVTADHDLWSLLREADALAPPGIGFEIFAADRLADLRGERPALGRPAAWRAWPATGRQRWIERAGPLRQAESAPANTAAFMPVLVGTATAAALSYRQEVLALAGGAPDAVLLDSEGEFRATSLTAAPSAEPPTASDAAPVAIRRPRPLRAAVAFAPDRAKDASYLLAALAALEATGGLQGDLAVTVERLPWQPGEGGGLPRSDGGTGFEASAPLDLAFWLGSGEAPAPLLSRLAATATLVTDGDGRWQRCDRRAVIDPAWEPLTLRRCLEPSATPGRQTLWRDALGEPLLERSIEPTLEPTAGHPLELHWNNRFDPAWSDLVTSEALPRWIAALADVAVGDSAGDAPGARHDLRATFGQGQPQHSERGSQRAGEDTAPDESTRRAALPLWATVALLLVLERFLAGTRR
jgi:hypothetical protein